MGLIQQTDRVNSRLSVAAAVGLALLLSTTAARSEDFHGSPLHPKIARVTKPVTTGRQSAASATRTIVLEIRRAS